MRRNLANSLAAGGVWALWLAVQTMEAARHLREHHDTTVPVGDGSDEDVLILCGIQAFEWTVNTWMGESCHMRVQMRKHGPRMPKFYSRTGQEITLEQWQQLVGNEDYMRVALWANEDQTKHVSTVWTGIDPRQGPVPLIFETMLVHVSDGKPHIVFQHRTVNVQEARRVHLQVVALVKMGRL